MSTTIAVTVSGEGKLNVEYGGFVGNTCFNAASELQTYLQGFGVDVDVVRIDPTKQEVEVRRIENEQSVGSGG
jgi:hypothetical protein